jgi:hypothetical protein
VNDDPLPNSSYSLVRLFLGVAENKRLQLYLFYLVRERWNILIEVKIISIHVSHNP